MGQFRTLMGGRFQDFQRAVRISRLILNNRRYIAYRREVLAY